MPYPSFACRFFLPSYGCLMPRFFSQQSMRFLSKHFPFFRYLLSSHCSHVYLHSQIVTRFIPSLFHVHPSAALCFVSTLLLMFVLGSQSVALLVQAPFPAFAPRLASHPRASRPQHSAARQHLLVSFVVVCISPLYHSVSLHSAKGFAFQAPEYISFTLPLAISL